MKKEERKMNDKQNFQMVMVAYIINLFKEAGISWVQGQRESQTQTYISKDSKGYKREKSGHQYENSNLCIIWCDR